MKYWNKDKRIRQEHWHRTEMPLFAGGYMALKRKLQQDESPGKFYLYHAARYVWFERKEDAAWFTLQYGK